MKLTTINQVVEALLALDDYHESDTEIIANEATIYWKMFDICERKGIDKAMKYYLDTHNGEEYKEFRTEVEGPDISLCKNCWCMTKTIDGKCGKCGQDKNAPTKPKLLVWTHCLDFDLQCLEEDEVMHDAISELNDRTIKLKEELNELKENK